MRERYKKSLPMATPEMLEKYLNNELNNQWFEFAEAYAKKERERYANAMCEAANDLEAARQKADAAEERADAAEQRATELQHLEQVIDDREQELARFKALEAHLPEGYAIGDDATATLAVAVESLRKELAQAQRELEDEREAIEHAATLLLPLVDTKDGTLVSLAENCAAEVESLRTELRDMREALTEIRAVACGENQVADDDTEALAWIFRKAEALLSRKGEGS
jgi:hypothetical protein